MALKDTTLIRFPRCKFIAASRQIAMLHLSEDFDHVIGQPAVVGYYKDQDHTEIDTIVAMGIKNGRGKDCFKVITTGQFILVWDIVYSLPDVSSLVHGELYLYNNKLENTWFTVTLDEARMDRSIEPITEDPKFYIRLTDNTIWVSDNDLIVRPLSKIYTRDEIDAIIEHLRTETNLDLILERVDIALERSLYAVEKVDSLEERIDRVEENSASINLIADLNNYVKAINLVRVYGEPSSKTWYGKNERRIFEADTLEFELIYHNYNEDVTTGFDEVTITVGEEPETVITPNPDGYYTNPMSIILSPGQDIEVPIVFSITYKGTKKYGIIDFYGLSEFRYLGRVSDPNQINLNALTHDENYMWRDTKPSCSKLDFKIDAGENGYYVYLYPESWGEINTIYAEGLIYYTPRRDALGISTFTKKTITINNTNFLCYYYRTKNGEEANNVNFI